MPYRQQAFPAERSDTVGGKKGTGTAQQIALADEPAGQLDSDNNNEGISFDGGPVAEEGEYPHAAGTSLRGMLCMWSAANKR